MGLAGGSGPRVVRRQAGGGQCSAVAGQCGAGLESFYAEEEVTVGGRRLRLVVTNGIPSHPYHDYSGTDRWAAQCCAEQEGTMLCRRQNPNEACRRPSFMLVPLRPAIGAFQESGLGPIGIARCSYTDFVVVCRSGAFLYNHKDATQGVAVVREGQSFDNCNGHADPMCR